MWTRLPDGWWIQGSFLLNPYTAGCPGCMETPLDVPVARVAPPPSDENSQDE